jgi:shikimate kinase
MFPLDDRDISKVSDETLKALFDTTHVIHSYQGTCIVRISQTLVLKGGPNARPCEASIMNMVIAQGGGMIALPKVHRVLNIDTKNVHLACKCILLMDFVEGRTLEECWEHLSEAERVNVVAQVASMITTLHSIPASQQEPGPVDRTRTCLARGYWFTDMGARPFNSKQDLEAWFNRRLEICKRFKQAPETTPPFKFDKLVLTHLDIAPRNLILGPDGKVRLYWGDAGIYPEGFEVAALSARRFSAPVFTDMLLEMIPRYEEMVQQLAWIMYALTTGQYIE